MLIKDGHIEDLDSDDAQTPFLTEKESFENKEKVPVRHFC